MTTSALNAIQRTGGAAGTAMLAIILQRTIAADLPGLHAGAQAIAGLTTRQRAQAAPALAAAFGYHLLDRARAHRPHPVPCAPPPAQQHSRREPRTGRA